MTHEDYKEMVALDALTALDGEEARAFADHLAGCVECHDELGVWQATASALAYAAEPIEPSAQLRDRILAGVLAQRLSAPAASVMELKPRAVSRSSTFVRLEAIAAVLVLVALLASLVALWQQNRRATTEVTYLSSQLQEIQQALEQERGVLGLMTRPGTRINELSGTKDAPNARAVLAFDAQSGHAILVANGLQPAPPGKAYQLWFMVGSRPVPGKVFNVDSSGAAISNDQVPPDALRSTVFAVTLEPQEGVPAPTGPVLLVSPASHSSLFADPTLRTTFAS